MLEINIPALKQRLLQLLLGSNNRTEMFDNIVNAVADTQQHPPGFRGSITRINRLKENDEEHLEYCSRWLVDHAMAVGEKALQELDTQINKRATKTS